MREGVRCCWGLVGGGEVDGERERSRVRVGEEGVELAAGMEGEEALTRITGDGDVMLSFVRWSVGC